MDIGKAEYKDELLKIIQYISEAHFVAFDLEFTGLPDRKRRGGKLSLQELYHDTREAAERYQILQIGLTLVEENKDNGCYILRPYNIDVDPTVDDKLRFEREWSCQSGCISFLRSHGFDHGRPISHGVPYLSRKEEQHVRAKWARWDDEKAALTDMTLKEEDLPLTDHIRTAIQRWQGQDAALREDFLNIPDTSEGAFVGAEVPSFLNRYQIRLVHQIVRNEFADFKTAGKGHFVQITMKNADREVSEKIKLARLRDRDVARATGSRWLIEAIVGGDITTMPMEFLQSIFPSDPQSGTNDQPAIKTFLAELQDKLKRRRRVVVGHNCLTDLLYLYQSFIGDLPSDVEHLPATIHELFPAVIDTKYLASHGPGWHQTGLQEVEAALAGEALPRTTIPIEFHRYTGDGKYHEAGYDSLVTARVVIKLSAKLERDNNYPTGSGAKARELQRAKDEDSETDDFITAPESLEDDEKEKTFKSAIIRVLSSPVAAVGSLLRGDQDVAEQRSSDESRPHGDVPKNDDGPSIPNMNPVANGQVVAVRQKPVDWSKSVEVDKVKAALAQTRIDDLLHDSPATSKGESAGALNDATEVKGCAASMTEDLMVWSDQDEEGGSIADSDERASSVEGNATASAVEETEMMPGWDHDRGFWQVFGNRLQVNGAEAGVFQL